MRTYHDLPDPPFTTPSNLTIGNFDGVHLGHQALIAALIADARASGRQAGLLTFHPHPAAVLRPDADHQYLTTIDQRLAIFETLGLDYAVVYPFTRATAATPASSEPKLSAPASDSALAMLTSARLLSTNTRLATSMMSCGVTASNCA